MMYFRSIPIMGTENIPPNTGASGSVSQNLSSMALVDHVDHMDWTNVPGRRIYENGPVVVENILYTQFGEVKLTFIYSLNTILLTLGLLSLQNF